MYKVAVMMSTYNGDKYLNEQIETILNQQDVDVYLYVRDDGSVDKTQNILAEYSKIYNNKFIWIQGKNIGPAKSFMDIVYSIGIFDYYAFSDQDDYWLPDKLINAIRQLDTDTLTPQLYFSKKTIVDRCLNILNIEDTKIRDVSFGCAILNSKASGCTMVFNKALFKQVRKYPVNFIQMHDAYIYKVAAAIGKVIYDNKSYIKYRQHGNNCVGSDLDGFKLFIKRISLLPFRCNDHTRSNYAKEIYKNYREMMSKQNLEIAYNLANVHKLKCRIRLLLNNNLKTQIKYEIIFVKFFILLGWI